MLGFAHAATYVTNYVADGQFETPAGDVGPWLNQFGGDTITFMATGGNPDGCVQIDDATSPGFGGFAYVNPPVEAPLSALGLTAGQTYTFVMDMQLVSGPSIGGLKVESWNPSINPNGALGFTQIYPPSGSTNWVTYMFTNTISASADRLNIVPVWGPGSVVKYDNIGVVVRLPDPVAVAITAPANNQIMFTNFDISATASVFPGTITNVAFYIDGAIMTNDSTAPFRYAAAGLATGFHSLQAVAKDSSGNSATSSVVNITVTNTAIPAATITFDAASSGSVAAANSCTWSHTVGSGVNRMLIVGISAEGTSTPNVSGVTYGGVPLLHVAGGRAFTSVDAVDMFYLISPTVGSGNVVVSFTGNVGAACGAVSLFGVSPDAPEANNSNALTSATSIATSITTKTAGAWLLDVVNTGDGLGSFSSSPGTKRWDLRASNASGICSGGGATAVVPSVGLITDTWTYGGSAGRMAQTVAAFAPGTPVLLTASAAILSPTNTQSVSTTSFTIAAAATVSPGTITNMDFYVDAVKVGNITNSPFNFIVAGATAGAHALKVVAKDNIGNSVTSAVVNVTALNFAPLVALTSPTDGVAVITNTTVPLAATASDDGTIASVGFYVDGTLLSTDATSPYNATWSNVPLGVHALTAVAHDNGGLNTTSAVVTVNVLATFSAYEPFDYGSLANGTPTTATGFAGNWICVPPPAIASDLTYSGLPTAANSLSSTGGRQFVNFAAPLSTGTEWISFVCRQTGNPGGVNNGVYFPNGGTGLFCGFGITPDTEAYGHFSLGSMNTTGAGYQGATGLSTSSANANYGTTYFVVLRIDFNTAGNNDTVTVYLNPPPHANAPGIPADQTSSAFDVGVISGVGVNVGNTSFAVDEIRRGSTYAEVAGGALTPTIPTTLLLTNAPAKRVSWTASNTNYYQPQKSTDNSNWTDLGSLLSGSAVTSVNDASPVAFYQILEIAPVASEQTVDGGFEVDDGLGNPFYWNLVGTQHPVKITSDFHSGAASMSLYVTNETIAANTAEVQQKLSFVGGGTIVGGNNYTLSFWAKSLGRNLVNSGYVQQYQIVWLNAGGGVVGAVGPAPFTAGTGAWTQVSTGPVVALGAAVNAQINIHIGTGGILNDFGGVLVDDVSLAAFSPGSVINILSPTVENTAVLTATVRANNATATDATGTVQFTLSSTNLSLNTVADGIAASVPAIFPASYTATATYSGDGTYIGSSATLTVGDVVSSTPTNIVASVSGNQLTLSWPASHLGWILQSQTNNLNAGLKPNWFDVSGSGSSTQAVININRANPTVFFRLRSP